MKLYTYISLTALLLASCTSNRLTTTYPDDVYYTPEDDVVIVQNTPQPAPQKYTPEQPQENTVNTLELVYDERVIPTEEYAGGLTDYERRIRRFRGEEFEYSYENGYVDGYRDANRNNRWNNSWNNGWYGYDNWAYSPWYGNSFWHRPRGSWHLGYNSRNGWYDGYSWGNPGWNTWNAPYSYGYGGWNSGWNYCAKTYYYGGGYYGRNNGWNGGYRGGNRWGRGYNSYGWNSGWNGTRGLRTASTNNSGGGIQFQGSDRYNRAANSSRQRISTNNTTGGDGNVNTRRPTTQRTATPITRGGSTGEINPRGVGTNKVAVPKGRRPATSTTATGTTRGNTGTVNGTNVRTPLRNEGGVDERRSTTTTRTPRSTT
ncbi:MAG: hypothetical protein ABF321_05310, partial [Bacteroidia bacterium]